MKYNTTDLYFAKCRHSIMDIVMTYQEDDKIISPRPDYVDYYTIILLKDNKYINIYDKHIRYRYQIELNVEDEAYDADLILEMHSIKDYIDDDYRKLNINECRLVQSTIEKTKKLTRKHGYKKGK